MGIIQIIVLATFFGVVLLILSRLKPMGPASNVDWGEVKKCDSGAERKLFQALARYNIYMRCQVPIGHFKMDIYIPSQKLCVEVDSYFHDNEEAQERDRRKDKLIRSQGMEVVRVRCESFDKDMDSVLAAIFNKFNWWEENNIVELRTDIST